MSQTAPVVSDLEHLLKLAAAPGSSTSEFKGAIAATVGAAAAVGLAWVNPSGQVSGSQQTLITITSTAAAGALWAVYTLARSWLKKQVVAHPALAEMVAAADALRAAAPAPDVVLHQSIQQTPPVTPAAPDAPTPPSSTPPAPSA